MRLENHTHIRHIMLYHYEKGWSAAQSFRDLNELFGKGTITDSAVWKWFIRFKSGDTSLEDKEGRGRPSDFDDQALLTVVVSVIGLTTQMKGNNGESLTKMASGNSTSTATSIWLSLIALTLQSRRKDRAKKNHIVFHHDNACPHAERRVIESIANKGWDLLPHPPYSPIEVPTDYHVNRSLENWQTNKVYDELNGLVADVKAWIASKNRDFFARGIDRLPSKWEAVLEVDGDYALE